MKNQDNNKEDSPYHNISLSTGGMYLEDWCGRYISIYQYTPPYHVSVCRYISYQQQVSTLVQINKVNHDNKSTISINIHKIRQLLTRLRIPKLRNTSMKIRTIYMNSKSSKILEISTILVANGTISLC